MDVVRTVENGIYEITFAFQLGQHIVESVGKVQPVLGCSIVKGNIVTTSEQLVIALFSLAVGIQTQRDFQNPRWYGRSPLIVSEPAPEAAVRRN